MGFFFHCLFGATFYDSCSARSTQSHTLRLPQRLTRTTFQRRFYARWAVMRNPGFDDVLIGLHMVSSTAYVFLSLNNPFSCSYLYYASGASAITDCHTSPSGSPAERRVADADAHVFNPARDNHQPASRSRRYQ